MSVVFRQSQCAGLVGNSIALIKVGFLIAVVMFGLDSAYGQPNVTIKFSHAASADSPKGRGATRFAELVVEYSKGRVQVEVHANSSLVREEEEFDALFVDRVQMLAPALTNLGRRGIRELEVFDLPFLFSDAAAVRKLTDSPMGKKLLRRLEQRGLVGLGYWDNGFNVVSSKKPIVVPGDFASLKILITPWHTTMTMQLRVVGAVPQLAPMHEWHAMLRDGTADGAIATPLEIERFKLHELQQHVTVSNHSYSGFAPLISSRTWEALNWEQKDALQRAMLEASAFVSALAASENAASIARMSASKGLVVHQLTNAQIEAWKGPLDVARHINAFRIGTALTNEVMQMGLHQSK